MFIQTLIVGFASLALAAGAPNAPTSPTDAVPARWDGKCFYPTPDDGFDLTSYLEGRWYQVAGTAAPFTAGCKCINAEYTLNSDGSVRVNNSCEANGKLRSIIGKATPAPATYGTKGVFRVQFPGQPASACPGPNYIVQDYTGDIAIVQTSNFGILFVLSRKQHLDAKTLDFWVKRAGLLGSKLNDVTKTDQSGCSF
ncbi:hypothetical protein HIM_05257 [Hirsutella minnesotensis 3608]|uniref:Lipocalin/cytosolic fatty-acid binding domain-containing protein n=1 Tax=Hirsutella minnesotensis 3608 TaxID=1043627 RepID=A0A0F7ZKK4_9HYPO|nr:hypothetical protein HIM_05257 [Hirsutella minnesotensis 3608]